jgi:uncharacterized membrane protein HdeD (DUF308 family)
MRTGLREVSAVWWWFVLLGVLWSLFGMFVLSYRVGSLAAVAAFVGAAFLFGGITQLAAELVLGVWAVRSWQRSLVTLVTLVGVWAIFHGVSEIFAGFSLRQTGKRTEQLVR